MLLISPTPSQSKGLAQAKILFLFLTLFFLQSTLSVTTILNTTICKELTKLSFGSQNSPSFTISHDPITFEDTEVVATSGGSSSIFTFSSSCHVVQMGSKDYVINFGQTPREVRFTFSVTSQHDFDKIVFVGVYDQVSTGDSARADDLYAATQTYFETAHEGGYVAYLDGKTLFMVIPKSLGEFNYDASSGAACSATVKTISGDDVIRRNCLFGNTDLNEYFVNQASYNVGTWMLIGTIFFFFLFLIASDNEMDMGNPDLRNNPWTLHPVYSIFMVGSEQFTKGSRFCQMTVGLVMMYLSGGVIYSQTKDRSEFSFIGILTISVLVGLILAYIMTYITGCLLRRAREVDRNFLQSTRGEFSGAEMRDLRDQYDRDTFVRYYEYYTFCGLIILVGLGGILYI